MTFPTIDLYTSPQILHAGELSDEVIGVTDLAFASFLNDFRS